MLFQSLAIFLTISLSSCLPQLNEGQYSYWRTRPRSIPTNAYYSNQPATYQDPQEVTRYGTVYRPWAGRIRGPIARTDEVKETRIMNSPAERVSMGEPMFNDQNPDFVFPGLSSDSRTIVTTRKPADSYSRNPYVPDLEAISRNCPPTASYCEAIDTYPSTYIHNLLKENPEPYSDLFGKDELVNIGTRIGVGDSDGTPMCGAMEKVIQPPAGKNANNEWKFIVNDEKYVQGIKVELCQSAGKPCAMSQNFPLSYETECKQKYIYRKLVALDSSGGMHTDNFRLPSCCVCIYRTKSL